MLPISEQYLNSPCEIRSMENAPILMGYISAFVDDGIQISSKEDALPLIHCNSTVKISILNSTLGFKVLIGRVYLSTASFIRIVDAQNAMDYEKRNFFRVKVNINSKAFPVTPTENGSISQEPIKIHLRDISLSGLFFVSDSNLAVEDKLIVSLNLYNTAVSLLCKIIRKIPVEMGTADGYGCEFLDNTGKQFDLLCKYLFDCQREQIAIMKQIHP
ncbi:MAG TPA: PilZ domain-containing protein [Caproicibacter sp.]|nr:PilZ domain-containing protein [Caproicibacter sp.]